MGRVIEQSSGAWMLLDELEWDAIETNERPRTVEDSLVGEVLNVAKANAAHTAMISAERSWTYRELRSAIESVAARLKTEQGLCAGERVLLMLPNSFDYAAGFYGILLAGGVVVPLPEHIEERRLQHIVEQCQPVCVLTSSETLQKHPLLKELAQTSKGLTRSPADEPAIVPDHLAALMFTSGSTGAPKGVMLTHQNLLANAHAIIEYLKISDTERALAVMPFCHAFGNSILQSHLLAGGCLVFDGNPTFPETLLDVLEEHQVTSFSAVPELLQMLLHRSSLKSRSFPALRYMSVAGGAMPPQAAQELAEVIAPASLFVMYGQTEATARLSYLPPELLTDRSGSIGRGIPGVELQVVDDSGQTTPADGSIGHLQARGPNVMLGYWRDLEGTARVLRDGWLQTGDLARIDADGFIYPCGRSSDLVKINGYRVHPAEIEEFLRGHVALSNVTAVAFEIEGTGTRLAVFLQRQPGDETTEDQVRGVCRNGLPAYQVPAHIEFMDTLLLNTAGKVDKPGLREIAAEHFAARVAATY